MGARADPRSGDIKVVVDDFVEPNGIAFSPDEKKLYVIDTGFTDGPDKPSHIRVFDADVESGKVLPKCQSPASLTGYALTLPGVSGVPWVGAIRARMACAPTLQRTNYSARFTFRKLLPACASAVSNEIDFVSAARPRSTQSTRVCRAL
jgi:hypothetical protein